MSRLGFKSAVFHGDLFLGGLDTVPFKDHKFQFPNNEIRIHHISPQSERCPPLSILQTIASFSVRCKLESSSPVEQPHLINLHASCFHELKTAVVLLGHEEIHLVAMPSKQKKFPCFWCYSVPLGLYNASLGMLNLRCLSIVFDLDETLIVANTMKSFEDRIEALRGWIAREVDPVRRSGMSAEMKRIMDDRALLKQYAEKDSVDDNGKVYEVQMEEVSPSPGNQEKLVRQVIRLQDRNIVLTRINPEVRDTSVLVRLRPAWEDLRSYLTAKGRKRFEVYVCTMAERDYAWEMWRLLDPGSHLIGRNQLGDRITCVKSGSRKSLLSVFQDGICHPKMAMVIDDRLKVWEDKDQPRVHVVPPFTPYYAPQAETANAVPVLCVARNVACNVRGCFFREFDESLLRRISDLFYEDEAVSLPPAPDVSNYLMSEDAGFVPNGNATAPISDGMHGAETERRLNQPNVVPGAGLLGAPLRRDFVEPSLLGAPVRREFHVPDSVHDINRRLPTVKHGLDLRNQSLGEPPLLSRFPGQKDEDINKGVHINSRQSGLVKETDAFKYDNKRPHQNPFGHGSPGFAPSGLLGNPSQGKGEEVHVGYQMQNKNLPPTNQLPGVGVYHSQMPSNSRDFHQAEAAKVNLQTSSFSIGVLQEIGRRCNSNVEFRSIVSTSRDLQFSVEVLFSGEKIGVGMGKTRKDAQQQAAENALHCLAERYVAYVGPCSDPMDRDSDKHSSGHENGFIWESATDEPQRDVLSKENNPEVGTFNDTSTS